MTPAAAWFRVPAGHQATAGQVPDIERFAARHGYEIGLRYELSDPARENAGGREYQRALRQAQADAHAGRFKVLVVQSLDRIAGDGEGGAEAALRVIGLFHQAGVTVASVQEPWLNGTGEVQDALAAFARWAADRDRARRSERIRDGLSRRRAEGKPVGRQPGATDKKERRRSGYVASWEGGARRAAHNARTTAGHEEA